MAANSILEGHGLSHTYGTHLALSDFHLTVEAGEITGLFGANGAGKTTTLRILCGLVKPTAGSLSVLGRPVSEVLARVGVVSENPAFYPNMTALENLGQATSYAGRHMSAAALESQLKRVGLGNQKGRVKGFSLGMKRRLALAIALAKEPDLLLLDEPTNGLDIDGVELFRDLLRQHLAQGRACIMSTHNWDEAERLVQGVVILSRGKTVYNGPLAELVAPGDRWKIRCAGRQAEDVLRTMPGVLIVSFNGSGEFLIDLQQTSVATVTQQLAASGFPPELVTPFHQPLSEVYRALVKGGAE